MISKKFCHTKCEYYAEDFENVYCLLQDDFADPDKCKYSKWGKQYTLEDLRNLPVKKKKLHIRQFSPLWWITRVGGMIGCMLGAYAWILILCAFFT